MLFLTSYRLKVVLSSSIFLVLFDNLGMSTPMDWESTSTPMDWESSSGDASLPASLPSLNQQPDWRIGHQDNIEQQIQRLIEHYVQVSEQHQQKKQSLEQQYQQLLEKQEIERKLLILYQQGQNLPLEEELLQQELQLRQGGQIEQNRLMQEQQKRLQLERQLEQNHLQQEQQKQQLLQEQQTQRLSLEQQIPQDHQSQLNQIQLEIEHLLEKQTKLNVANYRSITVLPPENNSMPLSEVLQQRNELIAGASVPPSQDEVECTAKEGETVCISCQNKRATRYAIPCGHCILCYECHPGFVTRVIYYSIITEDGSSHETDHRLPLTCPLCRHLIGQIIRIYH